MQCYLCFLCLELAREKRNRLTITCQNSSVRSDASANVQYLEYKGSYS